jgi:hypothetical protein
MNLTSDDVDIHLLGLKSEAIIMRLSSSKDFEASSYATLQQLSKRRLRKSTSLPLQTLDDDGLGQVLRQSGAWPRLG